MDTKIKGLNATQETLLKNAFGYESYPNGEHGHTREAVEWIKARFNVDVVFNGSQERGGVIDLGSVYFTNSHIKDLQSRPVRKWRR